MSYQPQRECGRCGMVLPARTEECPRCRTGDWLTEVAL